MDNTAKNEHAAIDFAKLVDGYLKSADWRVKENSTVTYSVGGLILSNSGAVTANYWLSNIYDTEIADAHRNADIHIHDLSMLTGYCAGWSLKQLIKEGLGGVPGKITSKPAAHLVTLCNQMVNFLGIMQNEWAGAQAFSSFDTYLAPFVKADNLTYGQVKKCIESFVYGVNTPSRWGNQSPFTNITLDWTVPDDLAELDAIVGGREMPFKYKDCKKEMDMVNRAFIEIMLEGDADGRGFQYPIPTYSITRDFDWSATGNNRLLFEMAGKYGTPYFSNYVNSDMNPGDVRSMCCRLRLDLRELRRKSGGFFGSGESTGSVGVVTINMPRIAYLATDETDFYARLDGMMDIAARSLKIKRDAITRLLDAGLYPYTKRYLGTFANHFSTIGLVGMNEACLNAKWIGKDLGNLQAQDFTCAVLNHMRDRLSTYQEQYGDLYNLEATPAESTAYRLAKHDREQFPDIVTANRCEGTPYYTNSSHLPVGFTDDVFSALDIQDRFQTLYTSGTVFHAFLGEKLPDWRSTAKLVRAIAENYRLPYYTISPTYSVCGEHGYISGGEEHCPQCGRETEIYSRITGYYRPIKNWNDGKAQEYRDRKEYSVATNYVQSEEDEPGIADPQDRENGEGLKCGNYVLTGKENDASRDANNSDNDMRVLTHKPLSESPKEAFSPQEAHENNDDNIEKSAKITDAHNRDTYVHADNDMHVLTHNSLSETPKEAFSPQEAHENNDDNIENSAKIADAHNRNNYVQADNDMHVLTHNSLSESRQEAFSPQEAHANNDDNIENDHNHVLTCELCSIDSLEDSKTTAAQDQNDGESLKCGNYVLSSGNVDNSADAHSENDDNVENAAKIADAHNRDNYVQADNNTRVLTHNPLSESRQEAFSMPEAHQKNGDNAENRPKHVLTSRLCSGNSREIPGPDEAHNSHSNARPILFATKTCPNCRMAKIYLDRSNIRYDVIYAKENMEAAKSNNIRLAPTLLVRDGRTYSLYENLSNIRKYAEEHAR